MNKGAVKLQKLFVNYIGWLVQDCFDTCGSEMLHSLKNEFHFKHFTQLISSRLSEEKEM